MKLHKREEIADTVFLIVLGVAVLGTLALLVLQGLCIDHKVIHGKNAHTLFSYQAELDYGAVDQPQYYIVRDGDLVSFYQEVPISRIPLVKGLLTVRNQGSYHLTSDEREEAYDRWPLEEPFSEIESYCDIFAVYFHVSVLIQADNTISGSLIPGDQFYYAGVTKNESILHDKRTLFAQELEHGEIVYFLAGEPRIG